MMFYNYRQIVDSGSGREGGREERREGGREEGGREGETEERREGGREGGTEETRREGGREHIVTTGRRELLSQTRESDLHNNKQVLIRAEIDNNQRYNYIIINTCLTSGRRPIESRRLHPVELDVRSRACRESDVAEKI